LKATRSGQKNGGAEAPPPDFDAMFGMSRSPFPLLATCCASGEAPESFAIRSGA
jgi:hypothetical protein